MLAAMLLPQAPTQIDPLAVLKAPYRTPVEVERAWAPVTRAFESSIRRGKKLQSLIPSNFPLYSVFLSDAVLKDRRAGHLVTIVLSARDNTASRSRTTLFSWRDGRLRHQVLDREIEFLPSHLYFGDGRITGDLALLTGSTWGNERGPGRGAAVALKWEAGRWRLTDKRATKQFGRTSPKGGRRPYVDAYTYISQTPTIRYFDTVPAFAYHQPWMLRGGRFFPGRRVQEKNFFWALDGLIQALRRGDDRGARAYCANPTVIRQAKDAAFGTPGVMWEAHDEGDANGIRRMQLGSDIGGMNVSASFGFVQKDGKMLVNDMRRYPSHPVKGTRPR
jgi:hypothetical protein